MDAETAYELERQKTIAENRLLLDSLGLDPSGASKIPGATTPKLAKPKVSSVKKRKAPVVHDEGPRRRSGRLAGIEATPEEVAKREEVEEQQREELRIVNRRVRDQVMKVEDMIDEDSPSGEEELNGFLNHLSTFDNPRPLPNANTPGKECYAEKDTLPTEVLRLKAQFQGMNLRANAKVTSERIYSMVVHPEKTKMVVIAADKHGQVGIWDALGQSEPVKMEDDTAQVEEHEEDEGRVWRVQAHARSAISCMKVDPVNGSGLYSTSYDCSLRRLDFSTLQSTEMYAFEDEDNLINHFDLTPNGQEAWLADKNGGISHVDFRDNGERRRWVVQDVGRGAKLGGLSVNPMMPHLIVTAGNDQHLRIWDARHLSKIQPRATDRLAPPDPIVKKEGENGDVKPRLPTYPTSSIPYEQIDKYQSSAKGKGLLRASYQHGKSCSSAYWDPWGRRILTTSYDDRLRVWSVNPQSLMLDTPLSPTHFQPSKTYPHNCQTGRWLTILRANWSLNMDYMPHFTVGNMKRTLDVVTATGDKIVQLWADGVTAVPAVTSSHPSRVDCVVGGNTSGRVQLWTNSADA